MDSCIRTNRRLRELTRNRENFCKYKESLMCSMIFLECFVSRYFVARCSRYGQKHSATFLYLKVFLNQEVTPFFSFPTVCPSQKYFILCGTCWKKVDSTVAPQCSVSTLLLTIEAEKGFAVIFFFRQNAGNVVFSLWHNLVH